MPFVNELIPEHEFVAHRFEELDESHIVGSVHSTQWTVDRETGCFLRLLTIGREDWANRSDWVLGIQDDRYIVRTELVDYAGGRGKHCVARYVVTLVNGKGLFELSSDLRRTLLRVLGEALTVYGDDGLYSTCASFEARVEAQGEVA